MRHIRLTIAYDGTNYSGWQIQPNATTIQELVQNAVRAMTGEECNVVGAGRTDAGVHAFAQVASFRTAKEVKLNGFLMGLNTNLPRDIRITGAEEVDINFHPIRDAKSKHYRYIISEYKEEHPLLLHRSWPVGRALDTGSMNEAAKFLIGKHDFTSFRASDSGDEGAVRRIHSAVFTRLSANVVAGLCAGHKIYLNGGHRGPPLHLENFWTTREIEFNITGSGFLKHMVRNIVGTLVDVGLGRTTPEGFKNILEVKDRKKAGPCAPASGLYLVAVEYV